MAAVVGTLLLLEVGARAVVYGAEHWRGDYRAGADGYGGADWTREYYAEFLASGTMDWHPYVYWRRRPYRGRFINVDSEGVRRTWRPPVLPADAPAVFVLGGSTVWGTGVRDDYTLASRLARGLAARGRAARVVNFGESGYVTGQSLALLVERLRRGDRPRVVIFYGGVEDVFAALQSGEAGIPQNESNRRIEFNALQPDALDKVARVTTSGVSLLGDILRRRLMPSDGQTTPALNADLARDVIDRYCSTVGIADALGSRYGFRVIAYWQPVVFTKQPLTGYEASARGRYAYAQRFFDDVYQRVRGASNPCGPVSFKDISLLFAAEPQPMYVDAFHLTETGTARVADEILPDVAGALPPSQP